jgi:hypothetical protein
MEKSILASDTERRVPLHSARQLHKNRREKLENPEHTIELFTWKMPPLNFSYVRIKQKLLRERGIPDYLPKSKVQTHTHTHKRERVSQIICDASCCCVMCLSISVHAQTKCH